MRVDVCVVVQDVAAKFRIAVMPTLIVIKNGVEVERINPSIDTLTAFVNKHA